MILTAVAQRLRDAAMPPLTSVAGAEELEAIGKGTAPNHGAAFVVPFEDRAEPSPFALGSFRQRVDVLFLVALVIRRQDDMRGDLRIQAADTLRMASEAALAGWSWDDSGAVLQLTLSRATPAANGVTWYVQTWQGERWIEG